MDDRELERMLAAIGSEEFTPDPSLVIRTKRRIKRGVLLPWLMFGSLSLQFLTMIGMAVILSSDALSWTVKLYGLVGVSLLLGLFLLPLVAVRDQIACFFGESDSSLEYC